MQVGKHGNLVYPQRPVQVIITSTRDSWASSQLDNRGILMSKDLTQKLNGSLEDKVDWLITAVQSMDSRLESMDSRLESMDSRLESMDSRLGSLETKVDQRLRDTQPIWEAVQSQL